MLLGSDRRATLIFNMRRPTMSTERAMLIAVQNTQADLMAGFTATRDLTSHNNGYNDTLVRGAINRGDIDGPRPQVSGHSIVWGANPTRSGAARRHHHPGPTRRVPPSASTSNPARLDQALPDRRLFLHADREAIPLTLYAGARIKVEE